MAINPPNLGTISIEEELAARILADALPRLQEAYFNLKALQETWLINGMSEKVDAALAAGTPITGFSAAHWRDWGDALTATLAFIDQPLAEGRPSVKQILLKRYMKEGVSNG